MYLRISQTGRSQRRGVILLVVLAMLTLFALIGLAFFFYASSEAQSALVAKETEDHPPDEITLPPDPPETLLSNWLAQWIFDTNDTPTSSTNPGLASSLRGHGLVRLMYGWRPPAETGGANTNTVAYNGVGRRHYTITTTPAGALEGQDDYYLPHYLYFANDGLKRDPERVGPTDALQPFNSPANVPYTYPDLNNMFLAAIRADGTVLARSFHRDWTGFGSLDPANPKWWSDTVGKYQVLRPRPVDHLRQADVTGAGLPWPLKPETLSPAQQTTLTTLITTLQSQGKLFPNTENAGGDVRNYAGAAGTLNDSIWMDLGLPVETMPDGIKKYKPLFAPLILCLDSRLNLNVVGNILGQNNVHASNMGFGAWEINPRQLVDTTSPDPKAAVKLSEVIQLFRGAYGTSGALTTAGRYGSDAQPGDGTSTSNNAPAWRVAYYYGQVDYDGVQETANRAPTTRFTMPGSGSLASWSCYPSFVDLSTTPAAQIGYGGWSAAERKNHPSLFNYFLPYGGDRTFDVSNMKALAYDPTKALDIYSDMNKLAPTLFGTDAYAKRARQLVTMHSMDPDRPGLTPWAMIPDPTQPPPQAYQWAGTPGTYPTGAAMTFPNLGDPPAGGEFGTDMRAINFADTAPNNILSRLDINRDLPPYPEPDYTTWRIDLTDPKFGQAQQARQQMALEIFNKLRQAAGARPPAAVNPTTNANEYNALRWLAQLAVNVVDFVDIDFFVTPFNWDTTNGGWVFGTEQLRLGVNEAYAEYANDPADPGLAMNMAQSDYTVNFWVELHNPMSSSDPNIAGGGSTRLYVPETGAGLKNGWGVYQVVVADPQPASFRAASNATGDPAAGTTRLIVNHLVPEDQPIKPGTPTPQPPTSTSDPKYRDYYVVLPADGAFGGPNELNKGFYLLGPKYDFPGTNAGKPVATLRVKDIAAGDTSYTNPVPYPTGTPRPRNGMFFNVPNTTALGSLPTYTILLRRLACPWIPPQLDPTQPNYNPYITVDYVENIQSYDGVDALPGGANPGKVAFDARHSLGRRQPYAAISTQQRPQTPDADGDLTNGITPFTDQPQHTFFRHNSIEATNPDPAAAGQTLKLPFDWLVHLDRQLVSPIELMMVSAYKPHELTQQFVTQPSGTDQYHTHLAPWYDPNSRIYRVFEFLETRNRSVGMTQGGRQAGKININNVWDREVFRALCDAQPGNYFSATDVDNIWNRVVALRSPDTDASGNNLPGPNSNPFLPLSTGYTAAAPGSQYPNGINLDNTLLRNDPANGRRLFDVPNQSHPYFKNQLLTKLFNNVTTRSNVFALWLTVGFFEVTDETTTPVSLGAELGKDKAQNLRHHMFAIIDRSAVTIANTAAPATTTASPIAAPGVVAVNLAPTPAVPSSLIDAGSSVTIDDATNRETVAVLSVNKDSNNPPNTTAFVAKFTKPHAAGANIYLNIPGNPGPQPTFVLKDNSLIVPYWVVLD